MSWDIVNAQAQNSTTSATSIYSPASGEKVTIKHISACNTTANPVKLSIFYDSDGSTYDESTALVYEHELEPYGVFEWCPCFLGMNNASGNIAYSTSVSNAITLTLSGVKES